MQCSRTILRRFGSSKGTAPGLLDTISGHVHLLMSTLLPPLPHLKSGRLRALGVTSAKRVSSLPDVPTVAEGGVAGYDVVGWYGAAVPTGTPQPVVAKLHTDFVAAINTPRNKRSSPPTARRRSARRPSNSPRSSSPRSTGGPKSWKRRRFPGSREIRNRVTLARVFR